MGMIDNTRSDIANEVEGTRAKGWQKLNRFLSGFPKDGQKILTAFNSADPLHVYYGDDVNPDEYVGYATRFLSAFEKSDKSNLALRVCAISCFHDGQLGEFASWKDFGKLVKALELATK